MNSNSCSDSSNESNANPHHHTPDLRQMNFGKTAGVGGVGGGGGGGGGSISLQQERYVWEMRTRSPNVTPASTVLNSPDLNADLPYAPLKCDLENGSIQGCDSPTDQAGNSSSYYYQRPHLHQIRVGRSPGSQFDHSQGLASPGSPTDVGKADGQCVRDGEIVVFDDIDTNWMNKTSALYPGSHEDVLKVTKMIGQLPIAEYEGSPRRFGNQVPLSMGLQSSRKRPPGYPQRVSPQATNTATVTTITNNNVAGGGGTKSSVGNLIDLIDHEESAATASSGGPKDLETTPTFDYLYEFSETRKVLEEFFKANPEDEKRFGDYANTENGEDAASSHDNRTAAATPIEQAYIGQRLARIPNDELYMVHRSPTRKQHQPSGNHNMTPSNVYQEHNDIELYIDSNSRSSGDLADTELEANLRRHSRNFTLSPETTDYDSNCGDLDSLSNDINCPTDYGKLYTSMPVLEDGLSSGHASDTENNASVVCDKHNGNGNEIRNITENGDRLENDYNNSASLATVTTDVSQSALISDFAIIPMPMPHQQSPTSPSPAPLPPPLTPPLSELKHDPVDSSMVEDDDNNSSNCKTSHYGAVYAAAAAATPPPPTTTSIATHCPAVEIQEAMKEIRSALQRAKTQPEKLKYCDEVLPADPDSPVWVPRQCIPTNIGNLTLAEEEADTDLETDRLLGQQRHNEHDFFADRPDSNANEANADNASNEHLNGDNNNSHKNSKTIYSPATLRQGIGTTLTPNSPDVCKVEVSVTTGQLGSPDNLQFTKSPTGSIKSLKDSANSDRKAKTRNKEGLLEPKVLIEGVLFRAKYLGSTQLVCEGQPTKSTRMMQAEEAVSRIKAPEGESQPSTEVDLFISTEKIMVLNTDLKEIMMDHALRTISYIADIGDLVVLMARRRFVTNRDMNVTGGLDESLTSPSDLGDGSHPITTTTTTTTTTSTTNNTTSSSTTIDCDSPPLKVEGNKLNRTPKMICHVFESDEAQFIAQSIGQAFQVAYMEFLKANGIENENLAKEMDYQEVLNSQEIFGDELEIFAKKELQKEVVVPKAKGEILGVVIVESGWGSMLPTVVIANLMSTGAAARCGQLNIGDQLIAINGMSLVGLPLSTCQSYIRNAKNQTAVKFTVVPCPPVVEVKILRPKALFQLGFSVQNGVICSLLRGGIAERGGVRVGHRIIEINNQSVVAVPHDTIVKLLSSSVGEILMKTMPTSMFRLLTGQETPIYI
ncbi:uncharacterized protein LOC6648542 isoform X1 [Drosophila willistoni]|uniref:uncharacterized protein LOC6648542 isoform X1 n=1 Tax=Drosophila willistoni TaxID=7260 RepID=UPI00017D8BCF|nr:uncharacterized protein LOC6648542 isoform X1 [Drosophila willistoni]XP_046867063.1 uncharacterized protein LOC6648542 isoform X1 [Drosophila willistoni]